MPNFLSIELYFKKIFDTSFIFRSGHNFFKKNNSVNDDWYIKKSLNLLKPPVLTRISGSGIPEVKR